MAARSTEGPHTHWLVCAERQGGIDQRRIYIWAVNARHIVDASLGSFFSPLLNVLIGALLLGERLRPAHWVATLLAALAVAGLTWSAGQLPWIALSLAVSFAV